jgi:hypothetical protein
VNLVCIFEWDAGSGRDKSRPYFFIDLVECPDHRMRGADFTGEFGTMRAVISEKLRAHLRQVGSNALTVTLAPLRC